MVLLLQFLVCVTLPLITTNILNDLNCYETSDLPHLTSTLSLMLNDSLSLYLTKKKKYINIWNVSPSIFLLPNTYVYILPLLFQWNRTTLSTYGQCHSLCFFLSSKTHTQMIPISFMNTLLHSSTWNIFILFLFYLLIRLSINPSSLL